MSEYYRYLKYLKYINGVPQDEYKQGDLIGVVEADSQADCEQGVEYRWVDSGLTMCDGYAEYTREVKQAYRNGVWENTSEYRKGLLIEAYSQKCGVRWKYRWYNTGLTKCNGYLQAIEYVYLVSKDMGNTWLNVEPLLYKYENIEGEEFNYDCVILTEPFEVTIDSDSDIGIWINNDDSFEHGSISGIPMMYGKGFRYIVDWGEGSPPILHVPTESLTNREISSMYKIPKHDYVISGTYNIKVWGSIGAITNFSKPYTINNWGKGLGTTRETSFKITSWTVPGAGKAYVFSYLTDGKYLSYIELGENCLGFPKYSEGLLDNNTFICNNSKFTDLGLDFTEMWTSYLFINCPNLTVTPKLCPKVNDIPNAYKMVTFEGCTKLTETPQGGMISNLYNDRILVIPSFIGVGNRIGGDYKNAFKGCTSLTKINGPIITFTSDFMFEGCTNLTNLNNLEMKIDSTIGMFKDCINLTGTYILRPFEKAEGETVNTDTFYCYFRNNMFENTKVSYIDPDMISSIKIPGEHYTISTERMFYNTPVTKVSFSLNDRDDVLYNMKEMFSHSTANNIDGLFLGLKSYPIMEKMFENCNITNLEGVFNYNTTYISGTWSNYPINWKYLYPMMIYFLREYSEEYLNASSNLNEMFSSNANLANYPTYNNYPMWYWTNLYKDSILLTTYAFSNCPLIAPEVPAQWGGIKNSLLPMTLSFTGEGDYYIATLLDYYEAKTKIPENNYLVIYWGDGLYDSYLSDEYSMTLNPHHYETNEKHTIKIYASKDVVLGIDPSNLTDIEDFGEVKFIFRGQYSGVYNQAYNINSIGATHGQFKENNEIGYNFHKQLTKIDPNFFTDCLNVTLMDISGLNTELGFLLKDYLPNLTSLSGCFSYSNISNFDGICEGLTELTNGIIGIENDAERISVNRAFKDCPKLLSLTGYSGAFTISGSTLDYNERIYSADECYMNCTSLTTVNPSVDLINTLESAVRAYCNTGVTSCGFVRDYYKARLGDCDFTEMFKDCTSLTKISSNLNSDTYLGFRLDGTLNLTRCFENCTALTKTPEFRCIDQQGKAVTVKLWEVAGMKTTTGDYKIAKNIIGTECFKGCTQLEDYDEIPSDWK